MIEKITEFIKAICPLFSTKLVFPFHNVRKRLIKIAVPQQICNSSLKDYAQELRIQIFHLSYINTKIYELFLKEEFEKLFGHMSFSSQSNLDEETYSDTLYSIRQICCKLKNKITAIHTLRLFIFCIVTASFSWNLYSTITAPTKNYRIPAYVTIASKYSEGLTKISQSLKQE